MAAVIEVKFFNSFLLKKNQNDSNVPVWNGSTGVPSGVAGSYPVLLSGLVQNYSYYAEEARIRGGYNNTNVSYGVRAYLVEDEPNSSTRSNSMIYSGIFNSRTGVNDTNVFSVGKDITKSVDPANGSIQKLYAEDTNLIVFQENKVSRALIDKDAIYSAEGGGSVTSSNLVIGQIVPYAGNFGISKNPESFAVYGYRKYFTDKNRNAVLRLSRDGITEISKAGMKDWFKDNLSTAFKIVGMYDDNLDQYVLNIKNNTEYNTLAFEEDVKGWTSFYSYNPDFGFSINKNFYTIKDNYIWDHGTLNPSRNYFYDEFEESHITFIVNTQHSVEKSFNTINYEGSPDWVMESSETDLGMKSWPIRKSSTSIGSGVLGTSFIKKENKYYSHIRNNTTLTAKNQIIGVDVSGIKGFFTTVKMKHDSTTNEVELFTVSHNIVKSS